jgi:hypothetical protein
MDIRLEITPASTLCSSHELSSEQSALSDLPSSFFSLLTLAYLSPNVKLAKDLLLLKRRTACIAQEIPIRTSTPLWRFTTDD